MPKTKLKIILITFSLLAVFFYGKNYALADPISDEQVFVQGITTIAPKTDINIQKETAASNKNWLQKFSLDKLWEELRKQSGVAFKAMLASFLNNMAADTATYLATGNWGQHPMFETKDFGSVLKYAADNAAGTFIEQLGNNNYVKFNLCKPDLRVLLKINLGLRATVLPKPPACTFSKLTQNWEQALKSKNFLPQFQDMFNPWSNDLGIALTLQTGMSAEMDRQASNAGQELIKDSGFKAVKDQISGYIKSPSSIVGMQADAILKEQGAKEKTYTGTIADAIDVFINTLAGKLLDKWLKKGLVTNFPPLTSTLDSLTNPDAQNQSEGAAGAADRMSSLLEPNFKVRGDYNVLNELATCPDPNKAGPTNCVIDEKFRQAIEKRLTVGQAMEQGFLSANGEFGFTSDGLEPKFYEGYPYRSMLILRKFRIIPVGWEVAAQKIKDCQNDSSPATCPNGSVGGKINLKNLVDCFRGDDEYGTKGSVPDWCNGLVDPNWVLKAPQNFCAREGAGPIITSEQITGQGADSGLSILRDDNYCADEKSLIKENSDGSNPRYGYCTEERRKWDFNSKSCEPRDNTCQTFKSEDGQTVSYLQNTLDYGNCTAGNAGCLAYCQDYDYVAGKYTCSNTAGDKIYLNKNAQECEAESEGCHQLIRLNPGGGANLLVNSDFEEAVTIGDWNTIGEAGSTAYQGAGSLEITKNNPMMIIAGADGYNIAGESYTLSFYSKNCSGTFSIEDTSASLASGADWAFNKLSYVYPQDVNINKVNFSIDSSPCLIDNIKLEKASQPTAYSDYGAPNQSLIYEKLMPSYLAGVCYDDQGKLLTGAPAVCSSFARKCKRQEAGCELYTGVTNGLKIPAQVKAQDYCPVECVGYDTFVQSRTNFADIQDAYFIPKTAKTCSAAVAGCDEFTNLEKVATTTPNVAEKKEYYSYLRQCLKPAENECGEFYSWEGSDESGYQLKVQSLASVVAGDNAEPFLTTGAYDSAIDDAKCSPDIYNSPVGDPRHNDDCRQFYNRAGTIYYRLYSSTKDCTEDCHPYRRTELNIDNSIASGNCTGADKHWDDKSDTDPSNDECVVCKSGGVLNADKSACIYMATSNQSATCSAAQTGCREYNGNTGNNVRNIFMDDFEADATTDGWQGVNAAVSRPNDSLILQNNVGHSLLVQKTSDVSAAKKTVGTAVSQGRSYVLSFLVKAAGDTTLNIFLATSTTNGLKSSFADIEIKGTDWQIKKTNLKSLDHKVTADEFLLIEGGQNFNIDNLVLTEITDRYYLIKNSWRTPAVCDSEADRVTPHAQFMLGCDQYQDRAAATHNLKQFNKLCSESAVGCEMMKDTKNSANPGEEIFNGSDADSKITVLKDDFIYAVYDQSKLCGREDKGCERLGQPYVYDKTTLYGDVYLKNNPDSYGQILCDSGAVGCKAWAYNNGAKSGEQYFKDPGDQACEWRVAAGSGTTHDWYKKKVKRCDDGTTDGGSVNGAIEPKKDAQGNIIDPITSYEQNICLSDSGCSIVTDKVNIKCSNDTDCGRYNKCVKSEGGQTGVCHYSCITDNNDYKCPTDDSKTLGLGGVGGKVSQPGQNASGKWAGVCQPAASGCTEYLDPQSKFNTNIIFNGDFHKIADNPTAGWVIGDSNNASCPSGYYCQSVNIEPNTVYRLAATKPIGKVKLYCDNRFYMLKPDNVLSEPGQLLEFNENNLSDKYISRYIYTAAQSGNSCSVTVANSVGAVELKPVVIDYQLAQSLDSASCNGAVNFDKGCVLFNQRSQDEASKKKLDNDADIPVIGEASTASERDSNVILKVTPDRTCNQWLAPRSYVKDQNGKDVIYDVGLCDAVDDNGSCSSFLTPTKTNQQADALGADAISNLSGYSEVGLANSSLKTDYYPLGVMEQAGEVANLSNGGFETAGTNGYPIGWTYDGSGFTTTVNPPPYPGAPTTTTTSWDANIFKVINNPIAAQTEGVEPAPEGRNFLKVGAAFNAMSDSADVIPNNDYVLTAYINTLNLKSGRAGVEIINDQGANTITGADKFLKAIDQGNGWQFILAKFNTGQASQIRIKLAGDLASNPQGNFYFDDIKIRPALNSKDNWYTNQACRLYPQTDSLSCDYYDDAGKRQKGWYGYCLQYDRPPGDPNACLLWYPIDKVKGDGIEEGAGYQGKAPLYYCLEAQGSCSGAFPKYYCSKLVEVVTPTGQNKFWSSNVYQGSGYELFANSNKYIDWGNNQAGQSARENVVLNYSRDGQPFGSIVPPSPASNPYEWDGEANTDQNIKVQPLYVAHLESEKNSARAGTPYYSPNNSEQNKLVCSITVSGSGSGSASAQCPAGTTASGCWDIASGSNHTASQSGNGCIASESEGNNGGTGCACNCINTSYYKVADSNDQALSGVKQLFAQSYGYWEWQDAGKCINKNINGNEISCNTDNDCVVSCPSNQVCLPTTVANIQRAEYKCGGTGNSCCSPKNAANLAVTDIINGIKCQAGVPCRLASDGLYYCNGDSTKINNQCCPDGSTSCSVCNINAVNAGQYVQANNCAPYSCEAVTTFNSSVSNNFKCYDTSKDPYVAGSSCYVPSQGACNVSGGYRSAADSSSNISWSAPGSNGEDHGGLCWSNNSYTDNRSAAENGYCAILPTVTNVHVASSSKDYTVNNTGFINLTFNSNIDGQQLPLVMYAVAWGDGATTTVSGVSMRDRSNPNIPHSLYHLYSYWDLKAKNNDKKLFCGLNSDGTKKENCCDAGQCSIKPKVQIKDNWGWCNGAVNSAGVLTSPSGINDCSLWQSFPATVVVKEK